jgi:hypothetical protein
MRPHASPFGAGLAFCHVLARRKLRAISWPTRLQVLRTGYLVDTVRRARL